MSRGPVIATLFVAFLLCTVGGASAAIFDIRVADDPDEGFNDTTLATPATNNPGTTVGEQRLEALMSAARIWESKIVSEIPIIVEVRFDALDCTATSGTLGGAGPLFVARDFPKAPISSTWYVLAQANALAGEDLSAPDFEPSIRITLNSDVGTGGCLTSLFWDYSLGVFIDAPGSISFYNVIYHELAHGLGFLDLVDADTGEMFQDTKDAYIRWLEDHDLPSRWENMTDGERLLSIEDTGNLHWVGPFAAIDAPILSSGTHPSGHIHMYAPNPKEGGSSTSHWDRSLFANADELMEPNLSRREQDIITGALMQDLGWSVNYVKVRGLENVDGIGGDDIAVLSSAENPAGHKIFVVDPSDGHEISQISIAGDVSVIDMRPVADFRGTPAQEIAVLVAYTRGALQEVQIFDALSGELVRTVPLGLGWPKALISFSDYGDSTADELGILSWGLSEEGKRVARYWVRDSFTTRVITEAVFGPDQPIDLDYVSNFGGGPAPELVIVLNNPKTLTGRIQVRDGSTAQVLTRQNLPVGFLPQYATMVENFGGTAADEIAILGVTTGSEPQVHILDTSSGETLLMKSFADPFYPLALESGSHIRLSGSDEVVVFGRRFVDQRTRMVIFDAATGTNISASSSFESEIPLAMDVVANRGGKAFDDVVIASWEMAPGNLRLWLRDLDNSLFKVIPVRE